MIEAARMRQQILMHAQFNFATDFQVGNQEHVQSVINDALRGIFHGHHAKICLGALHLLEYAVNSAVTQGMHGMSKMAMHRLLGKSPFRPQVGDLERFLLRQAGRHDFPKQADHFSIAERAPVAAYDAA